MRAKQCIVVEKSRNGVTVLTSEGRFVYVPIKNCLYMVGEQITLPALLELPATKPARRQTLPQFLRRRLLPVAAVASLILFASFFGYTQYLEARPTLAWVTIDLVDSPGSMELEVNDKGLIKSVTYFDEEGERIAHSLNLYMKPVDYAVEALLKTKQEGKQPEVVIGVIPVKEGPALDNLEKKLLKDAQKAAEKAAKETAKAAEKAAREAAKVAEKAAREAAKAAEKAAREAAKAAEKAAKETTKAAEKAAKEAEKAAKQSSKEAEKAAKEAEKAAKKARTHNSKKQEPQSQQTLSMFKTAAINHVRLDKQARDSAQELKISAARAVLWALFQEPDVGEEDGGAINAVGEAVNTIDALEDTGLAGDPQIPEKPGQEPKSDNDTKQDGKKEEDSKPKVPPGQAKKQSDFKSTIPRPGIDKIKGKDPKQDADYLSNLAKKWVKEVQKIQKSEAKKPKDNASGKKDNRSKDSQKSGNNSPGGK
ncbi:MAG TPA: anti-sigma factor domain-containing protein [Firmicutes bacterium]|nr:anti-sigma factor domain-containing protein [Candidatus Fermentithermobacillaceae bacterium]